MTWGLSTRLSLPAFQGIQPYIWCRNPGGVPSPAGYRAGRSSPPPGDNQGTSTHPPDPAENGHQITSIARVALQNRRALDPLTADKGGTCLFLQEECCYYINETGLVEDNVNALHRLREELQRKHQQSASPIPDWWRSALYTWLTPILGPLILTCILIMFAPFS
ncbi:endogenous retrovirus group FC1 Env polyprotein-like [Mesoplodon densirostris]|uniref:endogenous retrovirus group FC1 Env polyprotein-like n=1 Tax=Mesoplodon densirostris TaxID=48708 RepID=UPI0028DC54B7|nr:endogenous retrovirus group FC1 Env polyprotein-like [Mesoplodon densirostris]